MRDGVVSIDADMLAHRALAMQQLFDAVVVTDTQGIVLQWNAGAEKLYGYADHEIIGQPVSILHVPEDVSRVTAEVMASIAASGSWSGEIRRQGRDGSVGWIESYVIPLADSDGRPIGALGVNRDITARKLTEEALRQSEQRWRALVESSADAIVVADRDGRIVVANARAETLFGHPRALMEGQKVEFLMPHALRDLHATHRREHARNPKGIPMGNRLNLQGLHRSGRILRLEIGLSVLEHPGGALQMAVIHDMTVQHELNERLRVQGAALNSTATGVAISDANGVCRWVNPAFTRMTGYTPDEIVGHRLSRLKSGLHDEAFFKNLWQTITAGRAWQGEIINRHKLGHNYIEEQTISPVVDDNNVITHFVAIKQDITARKAMEDELRRANAVLQQQLQEIQQLQDQLREQVVRDSLTGLHNRRYLGETLPRELARAARERIPLVVAILDLDHFKRVNDTHGHAAGDAALIATARSLRGHCRESDLVCRFGGEEFIVVMPGATIASALRRAEVWRAECESTRTEHAGVSLCCTVSVGLAEFPRDGVGIDAILRAADAALYDAKRRGRNRVVAFHPDMAQSAPI